MSKLQLGIRFTDHHIVCPKCAGTTWLPVAMVKMYVGTNMITSRIVGCDNCGYRRLRPGTPDSAASESHDL
jgi:hypothetical protein